jgi:NAD-dependent SIR2 family protein deacetylase
MRIKDYNEKCKGEVKTPSLKEVADLIRGKKIFVLTGAGLSAASGIPTFRNAGGLYSESFGCEESPTTILTAKYFV